MGKAIYAKIAEDYYRINSISTKVPSTIVKVPKTYASLSKDESSREMTTSIWLSGMETTGLKSNRGCYDAMVEDLKKKQTTEIASISDQYVIYVDYSIYNEKDEEINHSSTSKRLMAEDALIGLGVAFNNECVYRRAKSIDSKIVFAVTNHVPLGIMQSAYHKKYTMKINDICILQCINPMLTQCFNQHGSMEGNSYAYDSHTIKTMLEGNIPVYSSAAAGVDVGAFTVNFYPRRIILDIHVVLANLIVAYDDTNVDAILLENLNQKYPLKPEPPITGPDGEGGDDTEDDPFIPDPDNNPDADGDRTPDEHGFYDYYERCIPTNPRALQVVEDTIPDNRYDFEVMVKYSKVLKDIPDIAVGETVLYVVGFSADKL